MSAFLKVVQSRVAFHKQDHLNQNYHYMSSLKPANKETTKQQQSCAYVLTRLHWSSSGQCVPFSTGLFIYSNSEDGP